MMDVSKGILLIADISGYTHFMQEHAIATSHAKQIIVRLIKTIVQTSKLPLRVVELEGDAVFFYAESKADDVRLTADQVKEQILRFFSRFNSERTVLQQMKACECDACAHVGDLRLKLVIHVGEVALEKIERFEKLFGLDVILVHRMLKNSVPSSEYVMMSKPMYAAFNDFYGLEPELRKEEFEGIGEMETVVFYPSHLAEGEEISHGQIPRTKVAKLAWKLKVMSRTLLDLIGIRKTKGRFRNLPVR